MPAMGGARMGHFTPFTGRVREDGKETKRLRPCGRCGRVREARPSSPLCSDCISVMSEGELAAWGVSLPVTRRGESEEAA